jgi:signal transduction histidine kinase
VEASHGITVETVVVGDRPLDDPVRALLAAGKEAVVNAAKWSGAPVVSVFAEIEPDGISMFVRDRGKGFHPDSVRPDRKGLSQSVEGRMRRFGGEAAVRSSPGEGTEVVLRLPFAAEGRRTARPT